MNKIEIVSKERLEKIINKNSKYHIAIIDGKKNKNWDCYRDTIEELYKFPTKHNNYDGYSDWIRDLSWINADGYILGIINYDDLLSDDLVCKNIIMKLFRKTILPWWDKDVEKYVVGGEKRPFNIYIVR